MKRKLSITLLTIGLTIGISFAQKSTIQVTGVILSEEDQEPIIGASIFEQGTTNGSISDVDGQFKLTTSEEAILVISFIGMETRKLRAQPTMQIFLHQNSEELEEVVVVAYGTVKKSAFTGSAVGIDHEKLKTSNASFEKALQGQVAGLQVMSASGQPGSTSSFRIRGAGSLNASNEPLYVVDGVPISANTSYSQMAEENYTTSSPLASLNPQDIESITILKDAAAASLYGSRAANGVVVITTKNGKKGKSTISFHSQFGFSAVPQAYEMMSSAEFYRTKWQSHFNLKSQSGTSPAEAAFQANEFAQGAITFNPYNIGQPIDASGQLVNGAAIIVDTDWQKEIFKVASTKDYNINVNGGNEKSSYFFSSGYFDQEGVTPSAMYKRYSGKANIATEVTSWLKAGMNITFSHSTQSSEVGGGAGASPLYNALLFPNGVPLYLVDRTGKPILDEQGEKKFNFTNPTSLGFNPIAIPQMNTYSSKIYRFLASAYLDFELLKNLHFKTVFSPDYVSYNEDRFWSKEHGDGVAYQGRADYFNTVDLMYTSTNTLNYSLNINDSHALNAMAGFEYWESSFQRRTAGATAFPLPSIQELGSGATPLNPTSMTTKEVLISYLGRVEYAYDNRYNLSFSLRSDGSSVFGKNNKWGTFWSTGLSWRIEQESFLKELEQINQLKLRLSYGTSGNNQGLGRYQSLGLWESSSDYIYAGLAGVGHTQLANLSLGWEKQSMLNIGLDYRFFDRLYGSIDYFNKSSKDLLYNYPLALSNGFESIMMNMAEVRNSGLEFSLGANILQSTPFKWDISFNLSMIRDQIKDLVDNDQIISRTKKIWTKGHSQYEFYMPTWAGVDPANGDPLWIKVEENGNRTTTNNYSQATSERQGRSTPDLYGGVSTNLSYRQFDLSLIATYNWGGQVYDGLYAQIMHEGNNAGAQMHRDDLKAWSESNKNSTIPRYVNNNSNSSNSVSTRFLYDATHVKLKNVTLSYTLPPKSPLFAGVISQAKLFVSAENLFTWFKDDWRGYDDIDIFGMDGFNESTKIPIPRTFTFGFNVTL